jgi:hypothetical protein
VSHADHDMGAVNYVALRALRDVRTEFTFPCSSEIQWAADAFEENLSRMLNLAELPGQMFDRGYLYHAVEKTINPHAGKSLSEAFLAGPRLWEPEQVFAEALASSTDANEGTYGYPLAVERLANVQYQSHIRALMSSILLGAWTAFEVLTEDLWVACLNVRPRLGILAFNADIEPGDSADVVDQKQRQIFRAQAWQIREYRYDLTNHMGDLLRDKWGFTKREKAFEAYAKVFEEDESSLKSIFSDVKLRSLCAVRNLIVHKAGVVDNDFIRSVKSDQLLNHLKKDDRLAVNGDMVVGLVIAAFAGGKKLIAFTSEWLKSHGD